MSQRVLYKIVEHFGQTLNTYMTRRMCSEKFAVGSPRAKHCGAPTPRNPCEPLSDMEYLGGGNGSVFFSDLRNELS